MRRSRGVLRAGSVRREQGTRSLDVDDEGALAALKRLSDLVAHPGGGELAIGDGRTLLALTGEMGAA